MTLITATVIKDSEDSRVGISIRGINRNLFISDIANDGLFAGSGLKVGQRLLSINNQNVQGMSTTQAITIIKTTTGALTILATDEVVKRPKPKAVTPERQTARRTNVHQNHPQGTTPGGQWGTNSYVGEQTGAAACVGFLCFFLPGLLILACPLDKRDAYRVDGKVYDAGGRFIGAAENTKFVPKASHANRQPTNPNRVHYGHELK